VTRTVLLEVLKRLTEEELKDIILPISAQKGDSENQSKAVEVHKMRLPDSTSYKKKAPYIIHQVITGKDFQPTGKLVESTTVIRSIFCVYSNSTEEDGAMMLLNLMERLRIRLLKQSIFGEQFTLNLEAGLEAIIYPDNTAPYFGGEMVSTWQMPSVQKEVPSYL